MFACLKTLFFKLLRKIKSIDFEINVSVQILYIIYLLYAIFFDIGIFLANIILLALSVIYLIFFFYDKGKHLAKRKRKLIDRLHKYTKRTVQLYGLIAMSIILLTSEKNNPLILTIVYLSALGLMLQVLVDVLLFIVDKQKQILEEKAKKKASIPLVEKQEEAIQE